ncbi:hypothetical protein [Glycocaulis sp.]|uniref:hypothetical protein n=1 Tax=Glycocaulis sp. TaxID=1969725 RepID=UPI003F9FA1A4
MSEPVTPIAGAYPPPALIVRNESVQARRADPAPAAAPVQTPPARMSGGYGAGLAGSWMPVLQGSQRRGLRADETERRRYRASYAAATSDAATRPAPRLERRA